MPSARFIITPPTTGTQRLGIGRSIETAPRLIGMESSQNEFMSSRVGRRVYHVVSPAAVILVARPVSRDILVVRPLVSRGRDPFTPTILWEQTRRNDIRVGRSHERSRRCSPD